MSDTAYNVSKPTIDAYNVIFNYLEACNEIADSLTGIIEVQKEIIHLDEQDSKKADEQINNLQSQVKEKSTQNDLCAEREKKLKKKNNRLKVIRNFLCGVVAVESAIITIIIN